jgi:hypothetical protein
VEPVETKLVRREAKPKEPKSIQRSLFWSFAFRKAQLFQIERINTNFGLAKWVNGLIESMA